MAVDEQDYDRTRLEQRAWAHRSRLGLGRREWLRGLAAAAIVHGLPRSPPAKAQPPTIVKPTPDALFRVLGTNRESRWEALRDTPELTPVSHFFVRNHTATPTIDPTSYRLRIEGPGVRRPLALSYEELLAMPAVSRTRAIECAGNGRSFFGSQQGTPAPGTAWQLGGIGVARWTGVPLGLVLERAGVSRAAVDVLPEGLDAEVGSLGHVRRPLPLAKAMDDVLLVHTMNGAPLPPDHGFPIRLLVPGWVGIAHVKWLGRITVSTEPVFSNWNTTQYRMTGAAYPEPTTLTTQVVKSAFELPFPATLPPGPTRLTGRSWSATSRIRRVDVSVDGGASWRPARLSGANGVGSWARWSLPWDAPIGEHTLLARATDARGAVQPDRVPFNDEGYLFGAVVRHPVRVV